MSESAPYLGPYLPIFLCGSVAALLHSIATPTADRHRRVYEGVAVAALLAVALTTPSLFGALSGQPVRSDHFSNVTHFQVPRVGAPRHRAVRVVEKIQPQGDYKTQPRPQQPGGNVESAISS